MTPNHPQLQTLATSDPAWHSFAATLPPAFLTAETPNPLAEDTANLLRTKHPELAAYLDSPPPSQMQTLDIIPTMLTAGAVLFLLRSHISFERTESGKISFSIVHPGIGDELITKIVETFKKLVDKII